MKSKIKEIVLEASVDNPGAEIKVAPEIKVAKEIGFCYGVKDAINITIDEAKRGKVYNFGAVIHNPQIVAMLATEYGVSLVDKVEEVEDGTAIIRTHGVPPEVLAGLEAKGIKIVDATCPFVKRSQELAHELASEGYFVVILGKREHPEVIGIAGYAGKRSIIVEKPEDLAAVPRTKKIGVVLQSTVTFEDYAYAIPAIAAKCQDFRFLNTVCGVTINRQRRVTEVAGDVQALIIVGGKNSSNTKKLVDFGRAAGTPSYHIEDVSEMAGLPLAGLERIGLASGTSTPDYLVEQAAEYLRGRVQNVEIAAPEA